MRELISTIEAALGQDRLARLKRDEDAYQQFWLGVLEAYHRIDLNRESVGFLVSNGYGAIRNMRRAENSRGRVRSCPRCGRVYGNRTMECPRCMHPTDGSVRTSSTAAATGEEMDFEDGRQSSYLELSIDIETFLGGLEGKRLYLARRWLVDRADMMYKNHLSQLAFEMGISKPRAAQIKVEVRDAFRRWYWGT